MSRSLRHSPTRCVAKWKLRIRRFLAYLGGSLGLVVLAACASPDPRTAGEDASLPAADTGVNPVQSAPHAAMKAERHTQAKHQAKPATASKLKTFAVAIKDYTRIPGYLNVYRKDEHYLLELKESDFAKDFVFTIQRTHGIGERGLWADQMLESGVGHFERYSDRVQWIERNTGFVAPHNAPLQRALRQGFSDSLRGVTAIVSQPDPETGAILIDLNSLVLTDFSATAFRLQATYHQPYQFDRGNSFIRHIYNEADETAVSLHAHYFAGTLAMAVPGQPIRPSVPQTLPDPRSMFFGFLVSFSALPDPAPVREADPRVGYFQTTQLDYDNDFSPSPRRFLINRWRLEKKNPEQALSEPVHPIVFWLDRNIPLRYRDTVRRGILAWNAAFEKAGFKNAIEVRQQPDDAQWSTSERHYASVRWYLGTDNATAIGPSLVDQRTGEILDADVVIGDFWTRGARTQAVDDIPSTSTDAACDLVREAFADLHETLDLLVARGQVEPDGPEAEALVQDTLYWVVMHEVGHTLGLRHNFRASSAYTLAQLRNPAFVAHYGLAASVMDYIPYNIPEKGQTSTPLTQKVLGPYDYWAIQYGYTPFAPKDERAGLQKITDEAGSNPYLAYGTDDDAGGNAPLLTGIDPSVARFDLGNDPVAWLEHQMRVSQELWDRLAHQRPDGRMDSAARARASVIRSLASLGQAARNATRNIGGVYVTRHTTAADREVFTVVPAATQRATLHALSSVLFSPESFRLDPKLLRRLAANPLNGVALEPQVPLAEMIRNLQSGVLDQLFSDRVSHRLLEGELNTPAQNRFTLAELYTAMRRDIWKELSHSAPIPLLRRNLQRAYLNRLCRQILQPDASTPEDARALARQEAEALRRQLRQAALHAGSDTETRAHLRESLATLDEVLRAPLLRKNP